MWRPALAAGMIACTLVLGCCATHEGAADQPRVDQSPPDAQPSFAPPAPVRSRLNVASSWIFDRQPGSYTAEHFTWRSDWPATESYFPVGQTIYFREHFHDVQGPGFNRFDHTYRRFDTHRVGVAFK